ncbi:Gfo/Idh/MocA family oxidoreductase [Pelagibacterales bacterium SAG-MED49]|nr:Gfo/Idh/MocA family oxidoreductase [Pelagibacterales bacterium SAG-MED49]
MRSLYKAAVIGLGRVGSLYPSSKAPRTHAETYLKNKRVDLVAGVDPDYKARQKFLKKFGKNILVFESVNLMLSKIQPDIVSICVPISSMIKVIKDFSKKSPKLFFLEKPVIENYNNSKSLISSINKIPTAVNYHRCWDPSHTLFFNRIKKKSMIKSIRVIYNGGILNTSSHIIALLIQNFGKISNVRKLDLQKHNPKNRDPSLSFILDFKCGIQAVFHGFDMINYDLLELEMITSTGIYSIKSAGCRKRLELPKKNTFYPNYNQLVDSPYPMPDGQIEGLSQAVKNIVNYLDGKDKNLVCDLTISLEVSRIISSILNKLR